MINTKKENLVSDHFNKPDHEDDKLAYKVNIAGQEADRNK